MAENLRLKIVLDMAERVLGPLKRIGNHSQEAAKALKATRERLKELNLQQNQVGEFGKLKKALQDTGTALGDARQKVVQLVAAQQQHGPPTRAMTTELNKARTAAAALATKHDEQQVKLQRLRSKLHEAGISTHELGRHSRRLREELKATNQAIGQQEGKLKTLARLSKAHGAQMLHLGMVAAGGAGGMALGRRVATPLASTLGAYRTQEDAASQLQAAMQLADGRVGPEYQALAQLAQRLGDKLPGTTADFYNMITELRKEGISAKAVLGGLGEATAYLGVQLKLPIEAAASFSAKMQDATRATEAEMMDLNDVIQRTFYLGVSHTQMQAGFSKMGGVLDKLRTSGARAVRELAPLLVMANQDGLEDGGSAGNAIRKIVDAGLDSKKLAKANAALQAAGGKGELNFVDAQGKYAGLDRLFEQLEKIKAIQSDLTRTKVIKELFGDDAETHQVLNTLMSKGRAGYQEVVDKLAAQASLRMRVEHQLRTLSNVMEAAQGTFSNVLASIGEILGDDAKRAVDWLQELAEKTRAWVAEHPRLIRGMALIGAGVAGLLFVGGALMVGVASLLGPLMVARFLVLRFMTQLGGLPALAALGSKAFTLIGHGVMTLGRALIMSPIGLAVVAIAAAALLVYKYWEPVKAFFSGFWEGFKNGMGPVMDNLGTVLGPILAMWGELIGYLGLAWDWFTRFVAPVQSSQETLNGVARAGQWVGEVLGTLFTPLGALLALLSKVLGGLGWVVGKILGTPDAGVPGAAPGPDLPKASPTLSQAARLGAELGAAQGTTGRAGQPALAVGQLTPLNAPGLSPAASQPAGGNTHNITIHTTPGMDPKAVGRAVSTELDRRDRANRSRVLSSLSDIE